MAKAKTVFYCQNCGAQSLKWIGKCYSCNEYNTYIEELVTSAKEDKTWKNEPGRKINKPLRLSDITITGELRLPLLDQELNRVLGGGLVLGSVTLISGEPGIGKSTLLLQLALQLDGKKVLYVSGEESEQQIKLRAGRMNKNAASCYIFSETSLDTIFLHLSELKPDLVIIDSVQTIYSTRIDSSAGSVSQIRECSAELLRYAKETMTPVILVGHITKDGFIAGPKVLEHMVDTVLQFEGDHHYVYRLLRSLKNRFGSTSEIGIYEMTGSGLKEISNPSEVLLAQRQENFSGIAIAAMLEGIRPILIETQALVSSAVYGTPQRSCTGFDLRRLNMLLAVLEKRCGFRLSSKDVFLNLTGGIRVDDPAVDLAVICAIQSSSEDVSINSKYCFAAEVGLSGEIRPVTRIEQRISEAAKLGFEKIFISSYNKKNLGKTIEGIQIVAASKVEEVFSSFLG